MSRYLYTASSAAQPGAGLAALDWLASHPVVAGILLGVLGLIAHVSGCQQCHTRHRQRRRRRADARDRALGRSPE